MRRTPRTRGGGGNVTTGDSSSPISLVTDAAAASPRPAALIAIK